MKIFDTHVHYNLEPLYKDWQKHWKKAQKSGVIGSVIVGTSVETSQKAVEMAKKDKNLYPAVGIHPTNALDIEIDEELKNINNLLEKNTNIISLGEIGLDYYRLDKDSSDFKKAREKQHNLLEAQLKLAKKHDLPIILHVRDKEEFYSKATGAYAETLSMMKKHYDGHKPFVLHCISGGLGYLTQAIEMGGYIGFCANVTYKKADDIRNLVKYTPMNRLLIETDAPFLPPQNYRGKTCEPWMISETAKFVQETMKIDPEWLLENTSSFFDIIIP